jgi:uncharacterized protein involved in response to NO
MPLLSYGFRSFFLGAALWATIALALWIGSLEGFWQPAPGYGALAWHAHEMLFGYSSAVVAGFLLTAVPNWTGRLPVAGSRLGFLFLLWCLARLAFLAIGSLGVIPGVRQLWTHGRRHDLAHYSWSSSPSLFEHG